MSRSISQEIQEIQQSIGQLVRDVRLRTGLSTTGLAQKLNYDPSAVSKAERGAFVSVTFIEKFLLTIPLDPETTAELTKYKEVLEAKKRKFRRQRRDAAARSAVSGEDTLASTPLPGPEQAVTSVAKGEHSWGKAVVAFCSRRWKALLIAFALLLVASIALAKLWPRQPTILGPLDFDWGCQQQYGPDSRAIILNPHDVYTWRCTVYVTGPDGEILSSITGIDTNAVCRKQYNSSSAWSDHHSRDDAYSWYCYLP